MGQNAYVFQVRSKSGFGVSMIPENIGPEHILMALREIDEEHWSLDQFWRGNNYHCLIENGRHYPPFKVISLANRAANGLDLPYDIRSYFEANAFLQSRGFNVTFCLGASFRRLAVINCLLMGVPLFVGGLIEVSKQNQIVGGLVAFLGGILVLLAWPLNRWLARGH
jgi:hypothetical protein